MTSQLKTLLLLAMLSGLIIMIGGAMGGRTGVLFAFVIAMLMNAGSYWYSDKIVLKMYKAQEVSPADAPALHAMVEEIAQRADIPKPKVCLIPEDAPNAFATGRDPQHGVVAFTHGILRLLSPEELKGVIAHEIGHIANRDILVQTVAGVLASTIVMLGNILQFTAIFGSSDDEEGTNPAAALLLAFLAPIAASLIQFAISRSREYLADEAGARFAGNPLYLANALEKLHTYSSRTHMHSGNQATAHMFIVNPFSGMRMAQLFSTHPPMEERIHRLKTMPIR